MESIKDSEVIEPRDKLLGPVRPRIKVISKKQQRVDANESFAKRLRRWEAVEI